MFNHTQKNVTIATLAAVNLGIFAYSIFGVVPAFKNLKKGHEELNDDVLLLGKIADKRFVTIDAMLTHARKNDIELYNDLLEISKQR